LSILLHIGVRVTALGVRVLVCDVCLLYKHFCHHRASLHEPTPHINNDHASLSNELHDLIDAHLATLTQEHVAFFDLFRSKRNGIRLFSSLQVSLAISGLMLIVVYVVPREVTASPPLVPPPLQPRLSLLSMSCSTLLPFPSPNVNSFELTLTPTLPAVLSRLFLLPYIRTAASGKRYIVFRIDQTMYSLKEAGKRFNLRLVSILSSPGFLETYIPCIFRHLTRPIAFVLVVDDFGVKYQSLFFVSPLLSGQGATCREKILGLHPRSRS
jgi:hypothetical protein